MYALTNYRTKKEFKAAVKASQRTPAEPFTVGAILEVRDGTGPGEPGRVYQPGGVFPGTSTGDATVEGPHAPEPHRWYARVRIEDGRVVKVLG